MIRLDVGPVDKLALDASKEILKGRGLDDDRAAVIRFMALQQVDAVKPGKILLLLQGFEPFANT